MVTYHFHPLGLDYFAESPQALIGAEVRINSDMQQNSTTLAGKPVSITKAAEGCRSDHCEAKGIN
jgi:hypothetical protein